MLLPTVRDRHRAAKKTTGKFRVKLLVNLLVNQAKSKEFQGDFMGVDVEDKFRKIYGSKLWVVYHREKSEQGYTLSFLNAPCIKTVWIIAC